MKSFYLLALGLIFAIGCQNKDDNQPPKVDRVGPTKLVAANYSAGELKKECEQALQKARDQIQDLLKNKNDRYFNATIGVLDSIYGDLNDVTLTLTFMGDVSPNETTRDEAATCKDMYAAFETELFANPDLATLVDNTVTFTPVQAYLRQTLLTQFRKGGATLEEGKRALAQELKNQLSEIETKFGKNLVDDVTVVEYTDEELKGLPQDFINSLPQKDGKRQVMAKPAYYSRVMEMAENPDSRKRMLMAWNNRQAEANTKLMEQALELRRKIAKLFGYKTWADYRIDGNIARNGDEVLGFLNTLQEKLTPKKDADLAILLEAKKEDDPKATKIESWDIAYYSVKVKKDKLKIDEEVIREYFPADFVIARMFEVYSQMLGVSFAEVPNATVWAEGVKLYSVKDNSSQKIIGYFFADLYPRAGKYNHAAAATLILGRNLPNGKYQKTLAAIMANLNPPTEDKPSLLSHDEVETLFHEFGHIMHGLLTTSPYAMVSGTNTKWDFVEAPSQMLENWVWNKDILTKISGHYTNTANKLPGDLVDRMLKARNFNAGYANLRQIMLGTLDMTLHTQTSPIDITKTQNEIYESIMGIAPSPDSHMLASFGHLMGGYDAQYYGYMWSKVYSSDMFTVFKQYGITDPTTGINYRKNILEPGGSEYPVNLVKRFLNREPTKEAFFEELDISSP